MTHNDDTRLPPDSLEESLNNVMFLAELLGWEMIFYKGLPRRKSPFTCPKCWDYRMLWHPYADQLDCPSCEYVDLGPCLRLLKRAKP
jgi:hypothetical protein